MRKILFILIAVASGPAFPAPGNAATAACMDLASGASATDVVDDCGKAIHSGRLGRTALADAYVNRASAYLSLKKRHEALLDLQDAIKIDPRDSLPHQVLGSWYDTLGDHKSAVEEQSIAIKLDPDNAVAISNRGVAYRSMGRLDEALADYNEAIKRKPDVAGFYVNRANYFEARNQFDRAVADMDTAKTLRPDDPKIRLVACRERAYGNQELEIALADCDRAVAANAKDYQTLDARCLVKFRMERYTEAIDDCKSAQNLALTLNRVFMPSAIYVQGLSRIRLGDQGGSTDLKVANSIRPPNAPPVSQEFERYGIKP